MTNFTTKLKTATKAALIATFATMGLYAATNTASAMGWVLYVENDAQDNLNVETQLAFSPIDRGESCWIRDYEPVPCPSDSWNAEELNAFDAEEQIAFDHRPCHQKRPGYSWGYGIFGTTCSRRAGEELNAFEAEELIAWEPPTKCYTRRDRQEEVPCPFNTEELNAFDVKDLTV